MFTEVGNPQAQLSLLISHPLTDSDHQLLQKMLQAINVNLANTFQLIVGDERSLTATEFRDQLLHRFKEVGSQPLLQLGGDSIGDATLIPHPAHLQKFPAEKRAAWESLKQLQHCLS